MTIDIVPYIVVGTEASPFWRRVLATEPMGSLDSLKDLASFARELDSLASLAVCIDGQVVCYV